MPLSVVPSESSCRCYLDWVWFFGGLPILLFVKGPSERLDWHGVKTSVLSYDRICSSSPLSAQATIPMGPRVSYFVNYVHNCLVK